MRFLKTPRISWKVVYENNVMVRRKVLKLLKLSIVPIMFAVLFVAGCSRATEKLYNPTINPADFVDKIDNQYYSLIPGTTFTYQSETEGGIERNEVIVTDETKEVLGVTTIVVWDRVWLDGELIEETYDWYAQDKEGNVWYFGEDSKEYEDGKVVITAGSWEAGVDGAKPGIIMETHPKVGDSYKQEYYKGEAEDMADVIALGETVTVPYGTFRNCLKTRDWSQIDPDLNEYKYYSPEIGGVVLEVVVDSGERVELIDYKQE